MSHLEFAYVVDDIEAVICLFADTVCSEIQDDDLRTAEALHLLEFSNVVA
jgi:hypothetical protein